CRPRQEAARPSLVYPERRGSIGPANGLDDHVIDGDVLVPRLPSRADLADLVDHVHALDHVPEGAVTGVVEVVVVHRVDVELRRGAVQVAGAGHGDGAAGVGQAVGRLVLDRRLGVLLLHARLEAAALDHEVGDDAVEDGAVVELIIDVGEEVGDRDRRRLLVQGDLDVALRGLHQDVDHDLLRIHLEVRRTDSMTTSSVGTSARLPIDAVFTYLILSTTSMPATTLPKTQYPTPSGAFARSRPSLSPRLMKNWSVALSAAFVWAIASVPRLFGRPLS